MKTLNVRQVAIRSLLVLICSVALFSFNTKPGGDSFSIYMNDKLLIQQFVHMKEKTQTISLQQASANDVLKIHYSHCGKMGVARNLFLKDDQNKTIKAWKFQNSDDGNKGAMTVQAAELAAIQKKNANKKLSLVYSAEQLPEGIVLAYLSSQGDVEASIK